MFDAIRAKLSGNKKGQASQGPIALLIGIVMGLLVAISILSFGFLYLAQLNTAVLNASNNNASAQAPTSTSSLITAFATIPTWVPLIIVAFMFLILLSILAYVYYVARSSGLMGG